MSKKDEEQEILDSYNRGEWRSSSSRELAKYKKYAAATLAKDKRVNIRISSRLLEALQLKAIEEGIPYQTLIASVLHKFIVGKLTHTEYNNRAERTRKTRRSR